MLGTLLSIRNALSKQATTSMPSGEGAEGLTQVRTARTTYNMTSKDREQRQSSVLDKLATDTSLGKRTRTNAQLHDMCAHEAFGADHAHTQSGDVRPPLPTCTSEIAQKWSC